MFFLQKQVKNIECCNQIQKKLGNYFTPITTKKLFGCLDHEDFHDCLSHRIDIFDEILCNNTTI